MKKDEVHILLLTYNISYHVHNDGSHYAGNGSRIISVHKNRTSAVAIAAEFNPVFSDAEDEHRINLPHTFNNALKKQFGFNCFDIDGGYCFNLVVETHEISR